MIAIEIRFLSGRFHGNPWQHAHNEGIAEWPPSPWRILRALVAAAYDLDIVAAAMPVLEKLCDLPHYRLPAAREAHVRHYMPDGEDAGKSKTKVFDSFIVVDGGSFTGDPQPVTAAWPVTLEASDRGVLEQLAQRVAYLGRAESWAELRVIEPESDEQFNCRPDERSSGPSTTVMALEPAAELAAWAATQPPPKKKAATDVPRSFWDVLTFDGARFRNEGWSRVPGTRLARYVFSQPPFAQRSPRPRQRAAHRRPTIARFAIRSTVLPRMTEALFVAERVRTALMSRSRDISGNAKPVFSGHHDSDDDQHQHAFILCSSEGKRPGFIDHVTVSAKMGFDDEDVAAIQAVTKVYGRDAHFLDLVLVGLGHASDYGGLETPRSPLLHNSRFWCSATPFVPTRHPRLVRGEEVDGIESQIRRACAQLGLDPPDEVTPCAAANGTPWWEFRRHRRNGGGRRGPDKSFGARLVFEKPQRGPIALGFGAHFGLGAFIACEK